VLAAASATFQKARIELERNPEAFWHSLAKVPLAAGSVPPRSDSHDLTTKAREGGSTEHIC